MGTELKDVSSSPDRRIGFAWSFTCGTWGSYIPDNSNDNMGIEIENMVPSAGAERAQQLSTLDVFPEDLSSLQLQVGNAASHCGRLHSCALHSCAYTYMQPYIYT